ncbi:GNAT family N-acetyltransferase [Micromonospora avicenniae]|uniref:GNAT family N-acetyltransferase n=1 Tax=Micromonospora avicenniae TaxID=1198245 RepID=UPI0034446BA6
MTWLAASEPAARARGRSGEWGLWWNSLVTGLGPCFHAAVMSEDLSGADVPPIVRPSTDRDLGDCVRVLAEVHERDGYPMIWPDFPAAWLTPPMLMASWVAELDGRIVGHIGLSRSDARDAAPGLWAARTGVSVDAIAVVNRLFVAPSARGLGIGALLMAQAVREAQDRGLHPVLDVVASDFAAAALYERLGWQLLATVEQQWSPEQKVTVRCYAAAT